MKPMILLAAAAAALIVAADLVSAREAHDPGVVQSAIHAHFAYRPPRPPGTRSALSARESRELSEWMNEAVGKGLVPVKLTDPRELRMLDLLQKAARRPPFSQLVSALGGLPAVRGELDRCEEFLREHQSNGLFVDVGSVDGTKLTAATLQSTYIAANPQDISGFGTSLVVIDSDGKDVTDAAELSNTGQVTLLTDAPPAAGKIDEAKPPKVGAIFTTFTSDGTPCPQRATAEVLPPPKSIQVSAPNNPQNRSTVICLNRSRPEPGWNQACDFGPFPQAKIGPDSVAVVVPLAGTITMPYPLALKDNKPDGQLRVTAINSQNGTTCAGQGNDLGKQVLAQTSATGDKQGVTWSILADKALIFGQSCYQPHSGLAFNMYWIVKVTKPDGKPSTVSAIVSNVLIQPSANTLIVRTVDMQWGCMPVGTQVTMADGTSKPIETLTRQDLVRGADGKPWQVANMMTGDEGELIEVTAEDGTVARMTAEHPVIVGRDDAGNPRWMAAAHVRVGTPLVTAKGTSRIAAVQRRPYGGKVYNIEVWPQGADKAPRLGGGFYADGLLVGDQTMQGLVEPAPAVASAARAHAN